MVLAPLTVPLPSAPEVLPPQQYAAPLVVTPQVDELPALTAANCSGAEVFGGGVLGGGGGGVAGAVMFSPLHEVRKRAKTSAELDTVLVNADAAGWWGRAESMETRLLRRLRSR
jgi:hypothetical protein